MANLEVQTFKSINEIDPEIWNRVVAGRGFQSHSWYQFGERVMAESQPTYLLALEEGTPIASAALFRVHNEPLPLPSIARRFMASVLKRRPLLVCRSPVADTSAMLLPGEPLRDEALSVLAKAAQQEFKRQRCSFLVFEFLLTEQLRYPGWPPGCEPITVSEPGTYMPMEWDSFETYLKSRNKNERQYFKENLKVAQDNGLSLTRHKEVPDIETALTLIQNVSIWNGSVPNPWMRGLLTNFSTIDGTWLQIHKDGQLVGCAATMRDNRFQLTTAMGLEDDVPGGYFFLLYAALQEAFEQNVRLVRFGSGAYDVKRMLGLHLEDTNHAMATIAGTTTRTPSKVKSTQSTK